MCTHFDGDVAEEVDVVEGRCGKKQGVVRMAMPQRQGENEWAFYLQSASKTKEMKSMLQSKEIMNYGDAFNQLGTTTADLGVPSLSLSRDNCV